MKKISWFSLNRQDASGENWFSHGYINAALLTIKALQKKECAVFYNRGDINYHINFCPATYYQFNSKYTIGYTPWESTKIPSYWIDNMRRCDEIWATSKFVKDVYKSHNVNANIHIIPHGISDDFKIVERELVSTFNFLHIGGDTKRKNAQMAVDAFLDLYEGNKDFRLILKYDKFCVAEAYINGRLLPASLHPQIVAIPENLSLDDLVFLYHKAHCLIYPTMGEGFGMIPFEAIATGLPTIVTNLTGCADFAQYAIPLNADLNKAIWNDQMYATDTGQWASPDFDDLCNLMENIVNEYDEIKKFFVKSAKILHSEWSWDSTADKILERLQFYENSFL
jgi:glycosyltransferase involved in cell wall biosynthesis